jgi:diphthine-ammonia ligase
VNYGSRNDTEIVVHSDNDFATVAFLRVNHADLQPKSNALALELVVPALLDIDFVKIHDAVSDSISNYIGRHQNVSLSRISGPLPAVECSSSKLDSWVAVTNIQNNVQLSDCISVEGEVRECFNILQSLFILLF